MEPRWGEVPRTSHDIANALPEVALADVRMGDILWWPGHVGLYAGNGWVIDALDTRHGVVVRPASDPYRAFRPASNPEALPVRWASYPPDELGCRNRTPASDFLARTLTLVMCRCAETLQRAGIPSASGARFKFAEARCSPAWVASSVRP